MDYAALENRLQGEIDALVRKNKDVFSAVLGVADTERDLRWAGAAGTAYAGQTEKMTTDTPVFIASITKMYTAAATMMLEERERLSLDEALSRFLPGTTLEGLHRYKGRDYSDQLRVYNLISHTSGLPDYFLGRPKGGQSMFDLIVAGSDEAWDVARAVEITKGLAPRFPPEPKDGERSGKKAHYSDTNYQLLGAVIESVTGKALHEVLSDLIIKPLGLTSTYMHGYGVPGALPDGRPATIYHGTRPLHLDKAMTSFGADGGLVSSVEDSLKFLSQFMAGKLFASPSTLERMKRRWRSIFFPFQYGLGLMRLKLPRILSPFSATPELIGHAGSTSAFLFKVDGTGLHIAGTLNQIENQGRPVRLMFKIAKIVGEALS